MKVQLHISTLILSLMSSDFFLFNDDKRMTHWTQAICKWITGSWPKQERWNILIII
jgi:hypothetical protein